MLLILLVLKYKEMEETSKTLAFQNIIYKPAHIEQVWINIVHDMNPIDCSGWKEGGAFRALIKEMVSNSAYEELSIIGNEDTRVSRKVEPLVSFLRHPLSLHPSHADRATIMNKDYYKLPSREDILQVRRKGGRLLFFDVGASLYEKGPGGDNGASLRWFIEKYGEYKDSDHSKVPFDRIFAWEATPYKPKILWETFPPDVVNVLQYFNVPAESKPLGKMNPLRLLRDIARIDDYVIFKLDVDHQRTELDLIEQILASSEISSLIDEIFWEHHVAGSAMGCPEMWNGKKGSGWSSFTFNTQQGHGETLAESYKLFTELRKRGIAAHSWV